MLVFDLSLWHQTVSRVTAPPDGFIAPPGYYLLFVVNNSGVPSVAKFIHLDLAWEPWFALGPNTFPLGSEVAAVSTAPGGTSLFVVGLDEGHGGGRVWTNSFPDPAHPNQWVGWRPLGDNVFRPGSPVTALSLARGATSLYLTGLDGQIWSNFFPRAARLVGLVRPWPQHLPARFAGGGGEHRTRWNKPFRGRARRRAWRRSGLDKLISRSCPSQSMGGLAAARQQRVPAGFARHRSQSRAWCHEPLPDGSRRPDMEQLLPIGRPDWSGWFALGPNTFPLGSEVAAVSTEPGGTSLFVVGLDSQVWSTFFSP